MLPRDWPISSDRHLDCEEATRPLSVPVFCHVWTKARLYVECDYGKALCHMWTTARLYVTCGQGSMFCHMWTTARLYVLSHVDYGKALCSVTCELQQGSMSTCGLQQGSMSHEDYSKAICHMRTTARLYVTCGQRKALCHMWTTARLYVT